jgi:hypothetical protein
MKLLIGLKYVTMDVNIIFDFDSTILIAYTDQLIGLTNAGIRPNIAPLVIRNVHINNESKSIELIFNVEGFLSSGLYAVWVIVDPD